MKNSTQGGDQNKNAVGSKQCEANIETLCIVQICAYSVFKMLGKQSCLIKKPKGM